MVGYATISRQSLYSFIIGREILNELKAVLYFKNYTVETNSIILPMQSLSAIQDPQHAMNLYRDSLEQNCIREETKCVVYIFDVRCEIADLQV